VKIRDHGPGARVVRSTEKIGDPRGAGTALDEHLLEVQRAVALGVAPFK
jgi:hypothetical protein